MRPAHRSDSKLAEHEAFKVCATAWVIAELSRTAVLLASQRGQGQVTRTAQRSLKRHAQQAGLLSNANLACRPF